MFYLLIRGRNCAATLPACINSLYNQSHKNWNALIWLDGPTDGGLLASVSDQFKVNTTYTNIGVCGSMYNGLNRLKSFRRIEPESPVGILDADDTLYPDAIEKAMKKFANPDVWVTHGSYIKNSKGSTTRVSKPYPKNAVVRKYKWRASHFKCFRYGLFAHLTKEDFMHNGAWMQAASDLALMFPVIELAGMDRVRFISKPIYHYNDNTGCNTNRAEQKKCAKIVRRKTQRTRLLSLV